MMVFSDSNFQIWSRRSLGIIIATLVCVSLSFALVRPFRALLWIGEEYYWSAFAHADSVLFRSLVCIIIFFVNVSLEIWALVLFSRLSAANRRRNSENFRLLSKCLLANVWTYISVYTTFSGLLESVRVICMLSVALNWARGSALVTAGWWYLTYIGFVQWFSSALLLMATRYVLP